MKWHEIGKTYGYPIAFKWHDWSDEYFVVDRGKGNLEVYSKGNRMSPRDEIFGVVGLLYFHWYEHDKWEPMFGFY